jgi:hypothetical protein
MSQKPISKLRRRMLEDMAVRSEPSPGAPHSSTVVSLWRRETRGPADAQQKNKGAPYAYAGYFWAPNSGPAL